jgi:Zn-dependent protease
LAVGRGLVETATSLADRGSWRLCSGILAAKFAAFNLVPIPGLNGWHMLSTIVLWRRPRPRWLDKLEPIAALVPLVLLCGWCIALAAAGFNL